MNRNQKIALGCGGAGCLGLIVVALACVVLYLVYQRRPAAYSRNYNFNVNVNRESNSNSDADSANPADTSSAMSEDDKHKLFQAASLAGDSELLQRVLKKLGLFTSAGAPSDKYTSFAKNHFVWALRNTEFIKSLDTPEKARAYVNEHIND